MNYFNQVEINQVTLAVGGKNNETRKFSSDETIK